MNLRSGSKDRDQHSSQLLQQGVSDDVSVLQQLRSAVQEMRAELLNLRGVASRVQELEDTVATMPALQLQVAELLKTVEEQRKELARGARAAPGAPERRDDGGSAADAPAPAAWRRRTVYVTNLPRLPQGVNFEAMAFTSKVFPDVRPMDIISAQRLHPAAGRPPTAGRPAAPPPLLVEFSTEAQANKFIRGWKALPAKPEVLAGVVVQPSLERGERSCRKALAARMHELYQLGCQPRWSHADRTEITYFLGGRRRVWAEANAGSVLDEARRAHAARRSAPSAARAPAGEEPLPPPPPPQAQPQQQPQPQPQPSVPAPRGTIPVNPGRRARSLGGATAGAASAAPPTTGHTSSAAGATPGAAAAVAAGAAAAAAGAAAGAAVAAAAGGRAGAVAGAVAADASTSADLGAPLRGPPTQRDPRNTHDTHTEHVDTAAGAGAEGDATA